MIIPDLFQVSRFNVTLIQEFFVLVSRFHQSVSLQSWNCVVLPDMRLTVGGSAGQTGFHSSEFPPSAEITSHISRTSVAVSR